MLDFEILNIFNYFPIDTFLLFMSVFASLSNILATLQIENFHSKTITSSLKCLLNIMEKLCSNQ